MITCLFPLSDLFLTFIWSFISNINLVASDMISKSHPWDTVISQSSPFIAVPFKRRVRDDRSDGSQHGTVKITNERLLHTVTVHIHTV